MSEQSEVGQGMDGPRLASSNIAKVVETARAAAAFGQPHTVGERTVIPAAEVMCGVGFGLGSGTGPEGTGGGSGGGGMGGARARAVAAIVIGPEGVEVQPIVDWSKIYLAALATAGFGLLWALRLARGAQVAEAAERDPAKSLRTLRALARR